MTAFAEQCAAGDGTIAGRAIHDRGEAWHDECRRALIAERAERRAIRLTGRQLPVGRVLVQIQREPAPAAEVSPS